MDSIRGETRIVIILAVVAVALALLAIVPGVRQLSDERLLTSEDEQFESAAVRLAQNELIGINGESAMAYDGRHKSFVETSDAKSIEPYGSNAGHKGKIIVVFFEDDGDITFAWETPNDIVAGTY